MMRFLADMGVSISSRNQKNEGLDLWEGKRRRMDPEDLQAIPKSHELLSK